MASYYEWKTLGTGLLGIDSYYECMAIRNGKLRGTEGYYGTERYIMTVEHGRRRRMFI